MYEAVAFFFHCQEGGWMLVGHVLYGDRAMAVKIAGAPRRLHLLDGWNPYIHMEGSGTVDSRAVGASPCKSVECQCPR